MRKKLFLSLISVILSFSLIMSTSATAFASGLGDILGSLTGQGGGNINMSEFFAEWLKGQIENQDESIIDKFVQNLKDQWNGVEPDDPLDEDDPILLREGEADNIAELFNITVNELKKGTPAFTKTQTASLDSSMAKTLQGGFGIISSMVESLIFTKDLGSAVIDGTQNYDTTVTTKYGYGNDVINNIPVSGKNYTACITGDDIEDYTMYIYPSGAYTMHIDLKDAQGASSQTGLAHVFDTSDKAMATIELGSFSLNVNVMFKYVNNFVECEVNRNGEITSYTMGMGITFLFEQSDGSYSTKVPFLGVDVIDENFIYNIRTEFTSIKFATRPMGDADNSGKVTSADARLILRMASQLEPCPETDFPFCDIDCNGKLSASDARAVLRAAANLETLPTSEEALGITPYKRDATTSKQVNDLLILIMAYQSVKDEEEQKKLQESYNNKYNNSDSTTTEEPTTGDISTTGDKVSEIIGGIGNIIGGIFG